MFVNLFMIVHDRTKLPGYIPQSSHIPYSQKERKQQVKLQMPLILNYLIYWFDFDQISGWLLVSLVLVCLTLMSSFKFFDHIINRLS